MNKKLFGMLRNFEKRRLTRRQMLQAMGSAALTLPIAGFGQGSCGGAKAGTPGCNTSPFPAPFKPTGWKTVLLDHFTCHVADLEKEAAFFNALMSWKVRRNDGKTIVMDMGTLGGAIFHGDLQVPAPPPPDPAAATSGRGGRGGRGRGPARAVWNNFCWGIEPWNTQTVEAELKKRGLNPFAEHDPENDFYSFHVKDPDGFDLQISNGNKKNRRTTPATGKLNTTTPFEATGWQTYFLDHISFEVTSYKETVAFYKALLGWYPLEDEGSQTETIVSPEIGGLLIRGGNANAPGFSPGTRKATMGHIAFDIMDFDPDKVKAGLQSRKLNAREDTGATGDSPPAEKDIHTSTHKSYHTTTPNGYDLQISAKVKRTLPG